ncbi:MFS transporter [Aspergillus arachidicola]|uniref:MFS transporter n=1 Tax=Aspergillus arachidicola TaxID=656916 RepID=A0A2G7FUA5_9EURO|nr:MFS transporter [Aspergillus arachidicola]
MAIAESPSIVSPDSSPSPHPGSRLSSEPTDIESQKAPSNAEPKTDPNLVTWDGPDDPANPQNWSFGYRAFVTAIWVYGNLCTCIASSIFSSGSGQIAQRFHVGSTVVTLGISLFLLGYTVGPPVWGPLSERFGRKWPMVIGMALFTIFCIPVAVAKNLQTVLIGRFLTGVFGAAPLSLVGGSLVDMWNPAQRGVAMACCIGTIFGSPVLAPLMGNFIVESYLGWRFTQWLSCIMGGSCTVLVVFGLPETFAGSILRKKAAAIRKAGNPDVHTVFDGKQKGIKDIFVIFLLRPFALLVTEPILLLVTIYQAFIYGILYLVFVSYPIAFREVRGWSLGISALPYIGMMVGILIGCAIVVIQTRRNYDGNTAVVPEQRLPLMIAGGCLLPVGLFIFAWTSNPNIHWAGMVIGSAPVGTGMYMVFVQCLNYLVDVYPTIANSAIGANTFVRSFFGAGFPLFGPFMYHNLGVAWASSTLGFISIAMIPIPVLFYVYGARIRSWSKNSKHT